MIKVASKGAVSSIKKSLSIKAITGSMKTKLMCAFLIILIIPMIVVTYYSIASLTDRAKTQMQAKLKSSSVAANLMLDSEMKRYETTSSNIANDNSLKAPIKYGMTSQLGDYCNTIKEKNSELDVLAVYAEDGSSIYASSNEYDNLAKNVLGSGKALTGVVKNKGLNIVSVSPVLGDENKIIGAVLVAHNMNKDKKLLTEISSRIDTNILLYEDKSLIMMSDSIKNVSIPKDDDDKQIAFDKALTEDDYFSPSTVDLFDDSYFINYKLIKDIDGKVVGALAVAETDADLKSSKLSTILAMGFIFVISLVFTIFAAFFASNLFTKPIIELMGLMKKVESGDLTVRSDNTSTDEIGRLSSGFNKMIEELSGIVNTITNRANEISSVSGEMATISETIIRDMDRIVDTMNEVMSGAENNSAAVQETTAGVEEISAKALLIASESKHTQDISKQAVSATEIGKAAVEDASNSISTLMSNIQNTSFSMKELESATQKILHIIKAIIYIGNETNLLALNASVEAARAGEAGKGFAVVAEEIKKLSSETKRQVDRVKELTSEIEKGTKKVVSEMDLSLEQSKHEVEKVNHVVKTITEIADSINDVEVAIRKITEASETQAEATGQISGAMENIAGTTTETAVSSSNVVSTIHEEYRALQRLNTFVEELKDMSVDFKETINKFKVK
ncbi:MAG: methyl-accepting chemotaxis protein [Clostridia bacterium]|nr:methyl-accepting chemotaxis protein [Clostridia bacterium]